MAKDESILASIDESYIDDEFYDRSIGTNAIKGFQDGNYIHPDINARYDISKILGRI